MDSLYTWFHKSNGSISVKHIPSNFTKKEIKNAFSFVGKIKSIEIEKKEEDDMIGAEDAVEDADNDHINIRIHYEYWYSTYLSMDFRHQLVAHFPTGFDMYSLPLNSSVVTCGVVNPGDDDEYTNMKKRFMEIEQAIEKLEREQTLCDAIHNKLHDQNETLWHEMNERFEDMGIYFEEIRNKLSTNGLTSKQESIISSE